MSRLHLQPQRLLLLSWLILPMIILWVSTNYVLGLGRQPSWNTGTGQTETMEATTSEPTFEHLVWHGQPMVTLWFDDAWQSQFDQGFEQLKSRQMVGSLAVPTGAVGRDGYMNWAQIKLMQHQGWETSSHTVHHSCDQAQLSESYVDNELRNAQIELKRHGLLSDNFVTPCGTQSEIMTNGARKYYSSLRTSNGGVNVLPVVDPYQLKVRTMLRTTTAEEVSAWIKEAQDQHAWLILVFHQIDRGQTDFGITPESLATTLDQVKASGMQVVLPQQVLQMEVSK